MNLLDLYSEDSCKLCKGCSILSKNKEEHSIQDYLEVGQKDILFVSDCFKFDHTTMTVTPFKKGE